MKIKTEIISLILLIFVLGTFCYFGENVTNNPDYVYAEYENSEEIVKK